MTLITSVCIKLVTKIIVTLYNNNNKKKTKILSNQYDRSVVAVSHC